MNIKNYIILITGCLFCVSCMTIGFTHNYSLGIKNISEKKISNVVVKSNEGFWFPFGIVVPNKRIASAERNGISKYSAKANYNIAWVDSDGKGHKVDINLQKKIHRSFNGALIFVIDSNNEVSYEITD